MTDDIKVLVTGGTGLVGTALAQYVQQDRHEANWVFVSSNDANLLEWEQVRDLFAFHQPTHVVHLAAMVGGLFHNMSANAGCSLHDPDLDSMRSSIRSSCAPTEATPTCL